jgi:hypothetical protein
MIMRAESPEVRELRAWLAMLPRAERCAPRCPGWIVCNGDEIQVCDECNHARAERGLCARLTDDDVAKLPEAQRALRRSIRELEREAGSWPASAIEPDPELEGGGTD